MTSRAARIVRLAGRVALVSVIVCVLAIVAMQFAGIVAKNLALGSELAASQKRISDLRGREGKQLRTIERLSEPAGAIPEIHDKLHLVGPHEELIYLRGLPAASPAAHWDASP